MKTHKLNARHMNIENMQAQRCSAGVAVVNSAFMTLMDWAAARFPTRPYLLRRPSAAGHPGRNLVEDAAVQETLQEHERLTRELKLAEQVQHQLLPQAVPEIPGYQFFAYYHAAHEVGGDYFDFVPLLGSRVGIVLGDVSGKGIAAALIMAKFSSDTRLKLMGECSAAAAATALNTSLFETGIDERFVTLCLIVLEPRTGSINICSAGHPPVLVRRADGSVEEVARDMGGFPLGVIAEAMYEQVEILLGPGDVAVVYSDGVTDARNPDDQLFDTRECRRLLDCIQGTSGGPEAVGEAILEEINAFSGSHVQADDITLVCFGPTGP